MAKKSRALCHRSQLHMETIRYKLFGFCNNTHLGPKIVARTNTTLPAGWVLQFRPVQNIQQNFISVEAVLVHKEWFELRELYPPIINQSINQSIKPQTRRWWHTQTADQRGSYIEPLRSRSAAPGLAGRGVLADAQAGDCSQLPCHRRNSPTSEDRIRL